MSNYNGERFLKESIESIFSQTFKDFEFIIIDDGSTDKSCKIIESYNDSRIVFLKQKNKGLPASLNSCIKIAKGELIARMDSDDISEKNRLFEQVNFLEKNKDIYLVGSWIKIIDENNKKTGEIKYLTDYNKIIKNMVKKSQFAHPSIMVRKEVFKEFKYDESYKYAQDYDLFLKISKKYKVANIPKFLLKYRFYNDNYYEKKQKIQEKNALNIRFKAIFKYNYPKWQIIYLIRPIISYCIPIWIKKKLLNLMRR